MRILRGVAPFAAVISAACALAHAQQPETGETEAAQRALETAPAPTQYEPGGYRPGDIPFERVLSSPDDIGLNIAYIRQRVAAGDLKEAAAALDRLLLVNPNLYDARVLYGFVLYRMQMYDRARFELEKALEEGAGFLPSTIIAEAQVYLDRIKRVQQKTRMVATVTIGADYSSNRNQAASSGSVLFLGGAFPSNEETGDFASIVTVQGQIIHDRGKQSGDTLHAEASYFRSDKDKVDQLDLDAFSAAIGGTWNFGALSVTPRMRGTYYRLAKADYLYSVGGEFQFLYRHNPRLRSYLILRGEHEDFENSPTFPVAENRSGRRLTGRIGAAWNMNPTMALNVEGLALEKTGAVAWESYSRFGANAQHNWLHGRGAFTIVGAWAERSDYDGVDAFVTPFVEREEWLYRARATAGAPLSWFFGDDALPRHIADINFIAQYEYEKVDSNISNYDYDTHKVSLLISKRFGN